MPTDPKLPRTLAQLISEGLHQGITQVEAAGSPLHPLLLDDMGRTMILYTEGPAEPMELALQAIRSQAADAIRCALVIDSRITMQDGKKWDAIVVMACQRGAAEGEVWAQRYVPKRLFRKFRVEGAAEKIGTAKDFITLALDEAAA